ncbi:MAG: hypothetical protein KatS3mg060_1552 [Dehalococcoidia bacterium]|nr:MAG: hypothetical protein KatS3mg060_1552 [Dehalococcoidia bacterium]
MGGGILLVTVAAVAVPLLRRRGKPLAAAVPDANRAVSPPPAARTGPIAAGSADVPEPQADEREALVSAIADLDDRYEAGEIGEEEWRRLRQAKKAALVALIREIRGI